MSLAGLDPVIHPPKRLAAMAILSASEWVEFAFLRANLGVSDSDLSKQMSALQEAGYARVQKRGGGRGSSTWFRITRSGRRAFAAHVSALDAIVGQSRGAVASDRERRGPPSEAAEPSEPHARAGSTSTRARARG